MPRSNSSGSHQKSSHVNLGKRLRTGRLVSSGISVGRHSRLSAAPASLRKGVDVLLKDSSSQHPLESDTAVPLVTQSGPDTRPPTPSHPCTTLRDKGCAPSRGRPLRREYAFILPSSPLLRKQSTPLVDEGYAPSRRRPLQHDDTFILSSSPLLRRQTTPPVVNDSSSDCFEASPLPILDFTTAFKGPFMQQR